MGFFDWFTQTPDHIISYAPGGHTLQVKITYNTETGLFTYRGRYGTRAKFYDTDIDHIDNKEVSRTHRVLLIQGQNTCLATLDVQRGLWVNTAAVKAAIDAGPPVETTTIEVEDTSDDATNTSNVVPTQDDPILRIKQLKELLDIGAITDEEFQQKKEELLNKI